MGNSMRSRLQPKAQKRRVCEEPSLAEILDDPIVQAVMARDGVERTKLDALILSVQARLRREAEHQVAAE